MNTVAIHQRQTLNVELPGKTVVVSTLRETANEVSTFRQHIGRRLVANGGVSTSKFGGSK